MRDLAPRFGGMVTTQVGSGAQLGMTGVASTDLLLVIAATVILGERWDEKNNGGKPKLAALDPRKTPR